MGGLTWNTMAEAKKILTMLIVSNIINAEERMPPRYLHCTQMSSARLHVSWESNCQCVNRQAKRVDSGWIAGGG